MTNTADHPLVVLTKEEHEAERKTIEAEKIEVESLLQNRRKREVIAEMKSVVRESIDSINTLKNNEENGLLLGEKILSDIKLLQNLRDEYRAIRNAERKLKQLTQRSQILESATVI